MHKNQLIHLLLGVVIGASVTFGITRGVDRPKASSSSSKTNATNSVESDDSMSHMVSVLKDKSGNDFDREFIRQMIPHHEGAIEMAKLIDSRAKHDEIKSLGMDIIQAQTDEINRMKSWYSDWGYGSYETDTMGGMDHSMMH